MSEPLEKLVQTWGRVGRDPALLPELMRLYHRDIHFRDPMQEVHGKDAFADAMESFLETCRDLEVAVEDSFADGERAAMVWRMAFRPKLGPPMQVDGVSHLRFEGGLVTYQRDYWDLADSLAGTFPGGRRAWRFLLKPLT